MTKSHHPAGSDERVIEFTFELGQLREETRHGWLRIYEKPESVAEHTQRAACLGYLLARMEGFADPNRIAVMILFHDIHETRTGDADKVQRQYLQIDEWKAISEQLEGMGEAGSEIASLWKEIDEGTTEAGKIAKDAEILEMVFTARELLIKGNKDAVRWIESSRPRLKTESARRLIDLVENSDPSTWWKTIPRLAK